MANHDVPPAAPWPVPYQTLPFHPPRRTDMLPLLPFVAGIAAGALAVKLWRTDKSRLRLDQAQETLRAATDTAQKKLRAATVSGLEAIEHSSAAMRERLSAEKAPAKKPVARKAAARPVAKKAAPKKKPAAPKAGEVS